MPKFKPRKVSTPGSAILKPIPGPKIKKRGRPQKKVKDSNVRKKYKLNYSDEVKMEAFQVIKSRRMSLREASVEFGFPKSTLADSIKVGFTILIHDINDQFSFREFTINRWDVRGLFHKKKNKYCMRE